MDIAFVILVAIGGFISIGLTLVFFGAVILDGLMALSRWLGQFGDDGHDVVVRYEKNSRRIP